VRDSSVFSSPPLEIQLVNEKMTSPPVRFFIGIIASDWWKRLGTIANVISGYAGVLVLGFWNDTRSTRRCRLLVRQLEEQARRDTLTDGDRDTLSDDKFDCPGVSGPQGRLWMSQYLLFGNGKGVRRNRQGTVA
jgi:hypothetical protein